MKLSLVTINYNDVRGLKKTLASVAAQTNTRTNTKTEWELEHIIIDGGSTDGSVDVIRDYATVHHTLYTIHWVSEKDNGIYNAMNKGIRMASGDYIQILNSGDIFASDTVLSRMCVALQTENYKRINAQNEDKRVNVNLVDLIYGNMLGATGKGSFAGSKEVEYSLRQYFVSTLNHDCCWIKRSLFDDYGLYDENLKVVSDWKWFLQTIGLGYVKPVYVDVDMTIFDGNGISSVNLGLRNAERRRVLEEVLPPAVLADYDRFAFPMEQVKRLKKYHLWGLVYFVDRVLFKLEKWHILK